MRIAIGADHAGYALKNLLRERLTDQGHEVIDVGTNSDAPVDYPDYARVVAEKVILGVAERGIMLGGSGEGECIAPNKLPGIRAALCHDTYSARMSREHNDANVLALGSRVIGQELAWDIVQTWLAAEFSGAERHARRLAKIASWERERRFPLFELARQGQSVWYRGVRRSMLTSGEFRQMVRDGVAGATVDLDSFEKVVAGSSDYDESLRSLASQGKNDEEIFQFMVLEDVRDVAEQLRPVYELTEGHDGYASIVLPPGLAHDTEGSVAMAKKLLWELSVKNVMIEVPATLEGISAIQRLAAEGVNVNVTTLFSMASYEAAASAYLSGLERLAEAGKPVGKVASVASLSVSGVDIAVDALLEERLRAATDPSARAEMETLRGRATIAWSRLAYQRHKEIFSGPRWEKLARQGARVQRLFWHDTGRKPLRHRDVSYVEELIGPDTVVAVSHSSLIAFMDHGYVRLSLEEGVEEARRTLKSLAVHGIDVAAVTQRLQEEGVKSFEESYAKVLKSISERREELLSGVGSRQSASLGPYGPIVEEALGRLQRDDTVRRIWHRDSSLWKENDLHQAGAIANRLGWLAVPEKMRDQVAELKLLIDELRAAGYTHAVLMGMGGSSLAPEVLQRTFGAAPGYLDLKVLDTTDPATILALERSLNLERTVFLVSSKSGTTTESLAYYQYFWEKLLERKGDGTGDNFIAITDPDTPLDQLAVARRFRRVFRNPPDIGGRYSALSYFGLAPAALIGMDVAGLLDRAERIAQACMPGVPTGDNLGAWLGAIMAALAKEGRDKVTLFLSPGISTFGYWVEQLLAESTGKEGTGLIPVEGEAPGSPDVYGNDRFFVYLRLNQDPEGEMDQQVEALAAAGHPVVTLCIKDPLDLGGEFFRWEYATAVAGALMGINPFDEPNVQESKDNTNRVLGAFRGTQASGHLVEPEPSARVSGMALYGDIGGAAPTEAISRFLSQAGAGDYISLMAYLPPNEANYAALTELRLLVRDRLHVATTLGFGPRFLHSTGQLHKGGPNSGLYLQITADDSEDAPVPGERYSFGALKQAQALGDFLALQEHGRRVLRVHLSGGPQEILSGLGRLKRSVASVTASRRPRGRN